MIRRRSKTYFLAITLIVSVFSLGCKLPQPVYAAETVMASDTFIENSTIAAGNTVVVNPGVKITARNWGIAGTLINNGIIEFVHSSGVWVGGTLMNKNGSIIVTTDPSDVGFTLAGGTIDNNGLISIYTRLDADVADDTDALLNNRESGIFQGGIIDHGFDINNHGILWCSSPLNGSGDFSGNHPLLSPPDKCRKELNLFEGNSFSDGIVSLGQELQTAVASRQYDDKIDSVVLRWKDSDGSIVRETTFRTMAGSDSFTPNELGNWKIEADFKDGNNVIMQTFDIPFNVIIEKEKRIADFNGDGYTDLAIGSPDEDIGSLEDAGAVHVIYGSNAGLSSSSVIASQFLTGGSFQFGLLEAFDRFGAALAVDDFDGDGYSDLAIGVPGETIQSAVHAGAVTVIYGSPNGLQANCCEPGDTTRAAQSWHQNKGGIEDISEPGDNFGAVLSVGDFDNDGYADLVVGVPDENAAPLASPAVPSSGAINVLYGSSSGLTATGDQFFHRNSPNIEGTPGDNDHFSGTMAVGDFNADGYDDLAIGVPEDKEFFGPFNVGVGSVNVIYGSLHGLSPTFVPDQFWTQDSPDVEGEARGGAFGRSVASGDFNNDGYDDLAIGDNVEGIGGPSPDQVGALNVIFGSPSGLSATFIPDQLWTQNSPSVEGKAEFDDQFGTSVASGDFNNDGFDDLAIAAEGEDLDALENAGAVNVLYGSTSGPSPVKLGDGTGRSDQLWSQNNLGVNNDAAALDFLGYALVTGDFNGDGSEDLVISVLNADINGKADAGGINVIYGSVTANGLSYIHEVVQQYWSQDSVGIPDSAEVNDRFGRALAAS